MMRVMHRWGSWLAAAAIVTAAPLLARGNAPEESARRLPAPTPTPTPEVGLGELSRRLTVAVSVADKGPFPFVIDTGAERSVVSRELAEQLRLTPGPAARVFDFTGVSTVGTVRVPSISAGPLSTALIEAPLLDAANLGAPGMLGIDALQGHKVVIDFDRKIMSVVPAKRHAVGDVIVRAQSRVGQLIVTKATFNGQPISVIIDTGTWISVGNKAMLALAKKPPRQVGPVSVQSVTGRSFDTDYMMIDNVKIGDVRFDRFGLAFVDVPPFERFGLKDKPALILGMSSIRMFRRVELDFVNREIAFTLPRPQIDFHDICRGGMSACRSL
jgi:predicted aspartyl protease